MRSPRSCARVARAGVEFWVSASGAAAAFVAAWAVVFFADAVALGAVAAAAAVASVAVLVALAVARRRLVVFVPRRHPPSKEQSVRPRP